MRTISRTTVTALAATLTAAVTLGACSGRVGNVGTGQSTAASPPAPASGAAEPTGTATSLPDKPATAALGATIVMATLGPLVYTLTIANLRTGIRATYTKPIYGQFIVVDITLHAVKGEFPAASPALFRLVKPDGAQMTADMFAQPANLPGVKTSWVRNLAEGETFNAQLILDAPLDLTGCRIAVIEFQRVAGSWTLP